MIIGVISDTHIPVVCKKLPSKIAEYFNGVDLILHAGDLVELSVIEQLKQLCPKVEAVFGNMDSPEVQSTLPRKKIITVNEYKIGLIHGFGAPDKLPENIRPEFEKNINVIVFGHAHVPFNEELFGALFFNPGSPTDKVFTEFNSIGILELNDKIKGKIIKL